MKKLLLALTFSFVTIISFADSGKILNPESNQSAEMTACTLTVTFHLTCGDYIGACYTCNGCSQETINQDLNIFWNQLQNTYCGTPGKQMPNPWTTY